MDKTSKAQIYTPNLEESSKMLNVNESAVIHNSSLDNSVDFN